MTKTANFGFLIVHDATLANLGGLAERYFRDDPPTCLIIELDAGTLKRVTVSAIEAC